jgi:fibronectin-binding autotransporter adhesin
MATIMMRNTTIRSIAFAAGIALLALAAPAPRATAADGSWNVNNAGNWSTAGSWLSNSIPGSTSSTTSTDIATFGFTLTAGRAVTVDANRNIGGIIFSNTSAFGYTLSSGNLLLSNGGVIQTATNNGAHTDTISSAIAIQGVGGSGAFTAGATSASSLLSIGAVTGVSTAGNTTTLTLNGDNTGANAVTGVIGNGSAGGRLAVVKSGNGVWVLSGANTFTGGVTLNSGTLRAGNAAALGTGTLTFGGGSLSSNSTTAYTLTNTMAFTGNATLGDTTNTGALTLSGNADLGGATRTLTVLSTATFGGVVSNGGLTKTGAGTFVLNAANTFTGTTAVNRGTLALDFSAAAAPATNILSTSSPLAVGGGTLQLTGKASTTNSQTVNGLAITPGASQITLTANATANPLLLTLGGINRSTGGTLNLTQPVGTIGATNGFTTTTGNTSGILGGWITVAGADWATNNGTNIVALASYTANTWAAGNNTNVTASSSPAADATTNSLRFNTGAVTTVTLSGTNTITSGGILVGTNVGSRVSTITGGTLRGSSGGDLVVFQNNTSGNLVIASQIADNTSATALTKSGAALLALAGANTYTGTTFVNAGTLQIGNGGTTGSIATSSPVSIAAGGTLAFNRSDNFGGVAFTNAISGAGSLTMTSGTLAVAGANNSGFTGTVNANGGQMILDFSDASAPATSILPTGVALSMGGGGLQLTGKAATANAQTVNGFTLASGTAANFANTSSIGVTAGSGGSAVLNLGAITRQNGNSSGTLAGRVMFTLPAGTQNSTNGIITSTTNTNGILGGWATIGQTDWATNQTNAAGGNIVALGSAGAVSSYTSSATAGNTAASYANANVDMVSSQTLTVSAGTINTLRFNDAAARTLALTGTNAIGAAGIGGILVTPAVGANLSRISGGVIVKNNLTGQADEIIINQFNTQGALQIDSTIGFLGNRMNLSKNGAGTLILNGNANTTTVGNSGVIYLNAGTIQFGDGTGGTYDFRDFSSIIPQAGTTVSVAASGTATVGHVASGSVTFDTAANARLNVSYANATWTKTGSGSLDLGTAAGQGNGWAKEGTVIINSGANYAVNGGLTIGDTAQNAPVGTVFLQNATRADQFGTAGTIINRTGALDFNNQSIQLGSSPTFVGGGTVTSSNVSSGTATLQGNVTYNAANAFDTGALIEKVTLSLGTADRTFTINDSAAVATEMTVSSNITGSFGISKAGAGTMLFSGTNTYSGATAINAGRLILAGNNTGAAGAITIGNGGTLQVSSLANLSAGALQFNAGSVEGNKTTLALRYDGNTSIAKNASGVGVSVIDQIAEFDVDRATAGGPTGGTITWGNSGTMAFNADRGQLLVTGSNGYGLTLNQSLTWVNTNNQTNKPNIVNNAPGLLTIQGNITTGNVNNISFAFAGTGDTLVTGTMGGAANWYVNKTGNGTLTLANAVTPKATGVRYLVQAGTLKLAGTSALDNGTTANWTAAKIAVASGATLAFNVGGTNEFTTGDVTTLLTNLAASTTTVTTSAGNGMNAGSSLGFDTTNASGGNFTIANNIANTTGTAGGARGLTKLGANTLTLSGSNTFNGTLAVQNGTVRFTSLAAVSSAQNLGAGTLVNLGVAGTSAGELDYRGAGGTLDKNITALGSGRNRIRNSGGGSLALTGTLTKNGTILELAGGTFNVSGLITGANANSDLFVNGASVTLSNTNNDYNGPTYVYGGGSLTLGVSNVIPNGSPLILGGTGSDTGTGTFDLQTSTESISSLTFGSGGGTVKMAANQTASPQLSTASSLTLGSNASLDLTGMQTAAGNYRLISSTGISGTFGSVSGLNSNYLLRYGTVNANEISAQRKAEFGTITATPAVATIITGGSTAFGYTVANLAPTDGSTLSFTSSNGSNVAGSSNGSAGANDTSSSISGLVFTGTSVGLGQTGSFTLTDPDAIGSPAAGSVTVNVLNHSLASFAATNTATKTLNFGTYDAGSWSGGDGGNGTLAYSIFNIASLGFTDAETAGLNFWDWDYTSGDDVFDIGFSSFANLASGTSNGFSASVLSPGTLSDGLYTATYTLKFRDQQNLAGAADTRSLTITMSANVIVVPEPGAIALAGIGIAAAAWALRRRK